MSAPLDDSLSRILEIPRQIVSQGQKGGALDVAGQVEIVNHKLIPFNNNSISVSQFWKVVSTTIYLGFGRKSVASQLTDTSQGAVENTIKRLLSASKILPDGPVASRIPEGPFHYQCIPGTYDSSIPSIDDEANDIIRAAINAALGEGANRVSGVLSAVETRKWVKTSRGCEGSCDLTNIELSVRSFASDGGCGQGVSLATSMREFDPHSAGQEAGFMANASRKPMAPESGEYKVVFGPSAFANFLEKTGYSASAFSAENGSSFLTHDQLYQRVASENLTLIDAHLRPNSPGAASFDQEGHPSRTTMLIEKGVFQSQIHDSRTAARSDAKSTGNATWSPELVQVVPYPSCLVAESGNMTVQEMTEEISNGILITNNSYTRFQNSRKGDFSSVARDAMFRIDKGELTYPLKGVRIVDNMLRILQSIRAISQERRWMRRWEVQTPCYLGHFLVDGVRITIAN